jgi:hypothetical protein
VGEEPNYTRTRKLGPLFVMPLEPPLDIKRKILEHLAAQTYSDHDMCKITLTFV